MSALEALVFAGKGLNAFSVLFFMISDQDQGHRSFFAQKVPFLRVIFEKLR
jgi:hypothetical protein